MSKGLKERGEDREEERGRRRGSPLSWVFSVLTRVEEVEERWVELTEDRKREDEEDRRGEEVLVEESPEGWRERQGEEDAWEAQDGAMERALGRAEEAWSRMRFSRLE